MRFSAPDPKGRPLRPGAPSAKLRAGVGQVPRWLAVSIVVALGCAASGPAAQGGAAATASQLPEPSGPAGAREGGPSSLQPESPVDARPAEAGEPPDSAEPAPGWLGVSLRDRPATQAGVVVAGVLRRSPADRAGLRAGDVVLAANGAPVVGGRELSSIVAGVGAGGRLNLALQRDGQAVLLAVELGRNPGVEGQLELGFVGAAAPEFEAVEVVQGALEGRLQALRGKVVVVEFWASWCGACRALMPTLNAWQQRFGAAGGAVVVSVTTDPLEKAARDAMQLGIRYPVLSDPQGLTTRAYQAYALPTLFLLDQQGVVRDVSVGFSPEQLGRFEQRIATMLDEG